ncbi:hypothetical protein F2Q68_00039943 [Brassica cretica]|uniref:Uncharacterized protein n=1 Tax=Brassica cretica TaxID=69181 RepID=A0A8S9MFH2_BRACR|nr:hypothetical protein F2Q68_00039943 [Brassica cretica]
MINDQYQLQENESKGRSFLSHIRHRIDGADHGFQTKLRRISPILTLGASDGPSSNRIEERSTEEEMEWTQRRTHPSGERKRNQNSSSSNTCLQDPLLPPLN